MSDFIKRKRMGRSIYFSEKEIEALRDTVTEWCSIMSEGGEDDPFYVDDRLKEGLGSALKKLYKGTNREILYKEF